jgi:hypothetical protein
MTSRFVDRAFGLVLTYGLALDDRQFILGLAHYPLYFFSIYHAFAAAGLLRFILLKWTCNSLTLS